MLEQKASISQELRSAYIRIFKDNPDGALVLKDLMAAHYILRSTFDIEPVLHAEREGERNVVLRILTILDSRPEDIL
jgi:hypothetical protein